MAFCEQVPPQWPAMVFRTLPKPVSDAHLASNEISLLTSRYASPPDQNASDGTAQATRRAVERDDDSTHAPVRGRP